VAEVKVYWTETALKAVEAIGDYIAKDAPERAIEFTDRLLESTSRLKKFPLSGSLCPEDSSCRHVTVNGHRVIYEITASGVEVLTVISPGQNPDQMKR
jgi:addiction module RelE/StbE family toxin